MFNIFSWGFWTNSKFCNFSLHSVIAVWHSVCEKKIHKIHVTFTCVFMNFANFTKFMCLTTEFLFCWHADIVNSSEFCKHSVILLKFSNDLLTFSEIHWMWKNCAIFHTFATCAHDCSCSCAYAEMMCVVAHSCAACVHMHHVRCPGCVDRMSSMNWRWSS